MTAPKPIPALLVTLAKPLSRLAAVLIGRRARIWYRNLPDEEKAKFKNKMIKHQPDLLGPNYSRVSIGELF